MKKVVSISLGTDDQDFEFNASFMRRKFNVRRFGTDGSTAKAVKLLKHWEQHADAIGIGVVKDSYTVGSRRYVEQDSARLKGVVTRVPVTTGGRLSDLLQEWAVRRVQIKLGNYFNNAKVLFFSGMTNYKLATTMAEYTQNLQFADPLLQLGVPKLLTSLDALELYASGAHYVLDWAPPRGDGPAPVKQWMRFVLRKAMQNATVIVAPVHELDRFGAEELAGKTIITSTVNDARIAQFKDKGVDMVIDGAPTLFDHVLGPNLLDAMILAATEQGSPTTSSTTTTWRSSPAWSSSRASSIPTASSASTASPSSSTRCRRSTSRTSSPSSCCRNVSPPIFMDSLEKVMAYAPPFVYSKVTGIKSPTGVEAEGWLISVGGTPKEIMGHSPEFTYRRLLDAADMARQPGRPDHGPRRLHQGGRAMPASPSPSVRRCRSPPATATAPRARCGPRTTPLLRLNLLPPPKGKKREVQGHGGRRHRGHRVGVRAPAGDGRRRGLPGLAGNRQAAGAEGIHPEGNARRQAVPVRARRQGHRRHGHDRHRHLGRGQEGARHHEGQARLRDHRRRAPARPAARGGRQAARTCW